MREYLRLRRKAERIAYEAHAGQKYSGRPYVLHLYQTALVLSEFGLSPRLAGSDEERCGRECAMLAAFLHDAVEDSDLTHEDIRKEFGSDVADVVWAVTDEPGRNRAERHAKTYPKIKANPLAIMVKLADRIANVRNCLEENPRLLRMYLKEWAEFKAGMTGSGPAWPPEAVDMWKHLERLIHCGSADTDTGGYQE